jgi:hypothetical protein
MVRVLRYPCVRPSSCLSIGSCFNSGPMCMDLANELGWLGSAFRSIFTNSPMMHDSAITYLP